MHKCTSCATDPVCDFCKHMDHSDPEAGEGMCAVHKRIMGWSEGCEQFVCFQRAEAEVSE